MPSSVVLTLLAFAALAMIACGGGTSDTTTSTTEPLSPTQLPDGSSSAPSGAPTAIADPARIQVDPQNPRYFTWLGEPVFPIGVTESGPDTCSTQNGWLAISSGFDWRPDLENMLAHGGNFTRVMPYFPTHPIQPWLRTPDGRYDLAQPNQEWEQRLEDYLAYTESQGIVVLLEVFDNWSFVNNREGAWVDNPWNPDNNVNYTTDAISNETERDEAAIYKAVTDEKPEVIALLQQYVSSLLDISLEHGNVIYNVSNESNAPMEWSEHWANYIRQYAGERDLSVLIGEMPHTTEPSTGLDAVAHSGSFDYVDAASQTSDDAFGKNEAAEIEGTDDVMSDLLEDMTKPVTIGKIYHRSPATLWSKFINGAAGVRYHRNCNRGGSDEVDPQRYFDYVQNLRTFVGEIDLTLATSTDDGLVEDAPDGVHADVLAAPGEWYAVYLYREDGAPSEVQLSLELDGAGYTARWFDPSSGAWTRTDGAVVDSSPAARTSFTAPAFETNAVLLVQISN